jgi:DNA polymerase-3 subunit gamma/tau
MAEVKDQAKSAPETQAALARKYRPQVFAELIGQEAIVRTLRNAFATGRIAQAYMLTGVRGVGKTTTARLVARALNYEGPNGDGPTLDITEEGVHCRAILESRHLDVIEMDAASHTGIDDIRDLIDSAHYKPNSARYKVYIIDEVHMLSKQAFNGLLKTLEEPPEHVKFIFATTEVRKVPVTVLSRCQRFDLKRIEIEVLMEHLAGIVASENAEAEQAALALIARSAEGSVRDALSILDRAIAYGSGKVEAGSLRELLGLADRSRIFDLLETVLSGDAGGALSSLDQLNRDGAEPGQVITDLADAVHVVTVVKAAGEASADPAASEAERGRAADLAKRLAMPVLARAWQMLLKGHDEVRNSPRPLAAADMVLVRLAYAADLPPPGEIARMLKEGESAGDNGARESRSAPASDPKPAHAESTVHIENAVQVESENPEPAPAPSPEVVPEQLALNSFEDLLALVDTKRNLKLKKVLLDQIRLVHFKPGNLEFNPLDTAPRDFAQELMRKLRAWTGRVWIVAVSDEEGAEPLGIKLRAERLDQKERELNEVRAHPAVKEVLQHFPDAQIAEVRSTSPDTTDSDVDDEPQRFTEDGTN